MTATDDMPMCDECGAILNDDGTCPDEEDHGSDPWELHQERRRRL